MSADLSRLVESLSDRYQIERELGQGGMATVYLAHDLRHERDVAVKVLHPDLGAALGGERFLAEIKTTARLQHPHILPLLDSGDANGLLYYVMPLVEGETLRALLERERQLSITDALRICSETASALDYAHRHGVVHRDIKPENILLHDGRAVVADFGIALAVSAASGSRMTQTGLSLGTPQYMAPEQAMGERSIDARADIYALGAVLYEMLTGEPPFSGATVQAIVAKVLTERPMSPSAVRDTVPPHVEAAVLKALAKLPADRFATIAQFAEALVRPELMTGTSAHAQLRGAPRSRLYPYVHASPLVWMLVGATTLLAAYAWTRGDTHVSPAPVTKVQFAPPGVSISLAPGVAISQDGSRIAYSAEDSARVRRLYMRTMDRVAPTPVAGSEGGSNVFFSPDGESIGFALGGKLRTMSLRGGSVTTLGDWSRAAGGTWGDDGTIVIADGGSLFRVNANGSALEPMLRGSAKAAYSSPSFLPGSRALLLTKVQDNAGGTAVLRMGDTAVTMLIPDAYYAQYADAGALVYQARSVLQVVPFDLRSLKITGQSEPLADDLAKTSGAPPRFAMARTGTIVYSAVYESQGRDLVLLDRAGIAHVASLGQRAFRYPRFSPDGRYLAFHIEERGSVSGDIWRYTLADNALLRLTADSLSGQPEWDPDGRSLVYLHNTGANSRTIQLNRISADGSDVPHVLLARPRSIYESRITPDHRTIVFREDETARNRNIMMAPLDSPTKARPLAATAFDEKGITLSPDGKWLAYSSNETGTDEVYIRRVAETSPKWPVSTTGGREPRWIRTGELFYRQNDSVMVTRVELGTEPRVSTPKLLFMGHYASTGYESLWDVSPDGSRFAFVRITTTSAAPFVLLLNWVDQWRVRHRVGAGR